VLKLDGDALGLALGDESVSTTSPQRVSKHAPKHHSNLFRAPCHGAAHSQMYLVPRTRITANSATVGGLTSYWGRSTTHGPYPTNHPLSASPGGSLHAGHKLASTPASASAVQGAQKPSAQPEQIPQGSLLFIRLRALFQSSQCFPPSLIHCCIHSPLQQQPTAARSLRFIMAEVFEMVSGTAAFARQVSRSIQALRDLQNGETEWELKGLLDRLTLLNGVIERLASVGDTSSVSDTIRHCHERYERIDHRLQKLLKQSPAIRKGSKRSLRGVGRALSGQLLKNIDHIRRDINEMQSVL
jgi:hypothetical protein